jgi:Glycosyl transferases group 1
MVLRAVDLYVKKGVFASSQDYFSRFVGKSNLTHYVWKEHGISPTAADIQASGMLEPADLDKLHLGWNIALDDKIVNSFRKIKPTPSSIKDVDILCRASVPKDWISPLRRIVIERLAPLADRYRVLLPTYKVKQDQYNKEMQRGRICVSPLGYGEVCWRDFEAIICGCLLVKPDMSHLRSDPDIFVPGETYVPVRWDYADLPEKCAYYLERESERVRISENAYRVLADYYLNDAFVSSFACLLERIGLLSSQRMASLAILSKTSS